LLEEVDILILKDLEGKLGGVLAAKSGILMYQVLHFISLI